ncbi:defensin-B4-like [Tachyglossus aculeatus]|uniref:defensin-B4-like n=1 Tax=Tachyglossus aculeatus TaxID=9261 RepID=UPI0018F35597|nr:defensin-B4-like [Tachyglossus aculeatus]
MRASLLLLTLLVYLAHAPQAQGVFGPKRCKDKVGYCRHKCQPKEVQVSQCSNKVVCCGVNTGTGSSGDSKLVPAVNPQPNPQENEPEENPREEATTVSE